MYDGLTGRYTFSCPSRGDVRLPLSAFRVLEHLDGTAHPVVYKVTFACPCGAEHDGLVSHDDLDWAPLGAGEVAFFNVMTARLEPAAEELVEQAARHIAAGLWPWSFFCFPEERARPMFPSAFRLLSPADERVGVAVRCPACSCTSVNLVSRTHIDVPFYNDRHVGVVDHIFTDDQAQVVDAFREELYSAVFDLRRIDLAP
jgi:hypothetical protein